MTVAKMGRPKIDIDEHQLCSLLRLRPTIDDCAAFFECSNSKIEKFIKERYGVTFSELRDQKMVHTRFMLVRKALEKAEKGDNVLLIFCLKNLCGWKDRYEADIEDTTGKVTVVLGYNPKGRLKDGRPTAEEGETEEQRVIDA